jgi:hypothetical protein
LQALWRRWTRALGFAQAADQRLRHYYVSILTGGRASQTRDLTEAEAKQVIRWLAKLVRAKEARFNYAAGTAGRRGYPEQRQVSPTHVAWSTLWACAAALGMQRLDLDRFIRRRYGRMGIRSTMDLRTMADLNRVLWGLKEILRRKTSAQHAVPGKQQVA